MRCYKSGGEALLVSEGRQSSDLKMKELFIDLLSVSRPQVNRYTIFKGG